MTIGLLGAGTVGRALATGFAARGHAVRLGTRHPEAPGHRAFAEASGLPVTTYGEATGGADVVVVATPWEGTEAAVRAARVAPGALVLDATNPLDFSDGSPVHALPDSAGERIQAWLPDAHVVKAFAMVGAGLMVDPDLPGGPPTMLLAGESADAKRQAAEILEAFGWDVADLGGIREARSIEALAVAWIRLAMTTGSRDLAFRLLRGRT